MTNPDNLLPILEFDELIEIFGYPNSRSARRAIRLGRFPVPVFQFANRTVAHVDVIDKFFKEKYDEGATWLDERYRVDGAAADPLSTDT